MKRIITCSDGTWNHPGEKFNGVEVKTNVRRVFEYLSDWDRSQPVHVEQKKFYDKGIGATNLKSINLFQGITGDGLDRNIIDVYRFISQNYEPGDEIYLFGFSRGAYTARSAVGFIRNSGLLKTWDEKRAKEAFELYRDRGDDTLPDSPKVLKFKAEFCHEPRIRMIGVWDTVGSLGIPLNFLQRWNHKRYSFHDLRLSRVVDYAYHALAIHERRSAFEPTLWEPNPTPDPFHPQVLEQMWFTGVHSNIGGGYDDTGLSDTALKWMMCKAQGAGLKFDIQPMFAPNFKGGKLQDSSTWYYKILGLGWREVCEKPNRGERIHPSVTDRANDLPTSLKDRYQVFLAQMEDWILEAVV